jgi:heme A synthase
MLIHDRLGAIVAIVVCVGVLAAVVTLIRPALLPAVRVYLRLTAALVAVQVLIGIVLVATGARPSQALHWIYGAATLLALPLAMWIGSRLGRREQQLWVAGGAIATLLFAFRAIGTG